MVSQAETIRDSIQTNWALTGELSKTGTSTMKEVIRFFDRLQVEGNEWPKAVTVVKINADTDENKIEHPRFSEVRDVYKVTCHFRVTDAEPTGYSVALGLVEDMAREVQRILELTFNPSIPNGTFFQANHRWQSFDHRDIGQPELIRQMTFELTKITSDNPEVFIGFGGVLSFDQSASVADSKVGADRIYTEAYNVEINEGYEVIAYMTNDTTDGQNVPQLAMGEWNGEFSLQTMMDKGDISGTTIERLHNIYKAQLNSPLRNELATIVLLQADPDTEGTPQILTSST